MAKGHTVKKKRINREKWGKRNKGDEQLLDINYRQGER